MKTRTKSTLQKGDLGMGKAAAEAPPPPTKRPKRVYDEQFRRNAVTLLETTGKTVQETARQLGCSPWNLYDWLEQYGKKGKRRMTPEGDWQSTITGLQQELESVRAERDILKKAMGILATPKRNGTHS